MLYSSTLGLLVDTLRGGCHFRGRSVILAESHTLAKACFQKVSFVPKANAIC